MEPTEKILAAFQRLNPNYIVHPSTLNEILVVGTSSALRKRPPFPGMPAPRHPSSWKECSLNTAAKQLGDIKKVAQKLQSAIEQMHSTTVYAFAKDGFYMRRLEEQLSELLGSGNKQGAIHPATANIENWKKQKPEWISSKTGAPREEIPFHIAMLLAEEYFCATGKKPSVSNKTVAINPYETGNVSYGSFLDFVTAVFDALNIKASPDAMARSARDLWGKRQKAREDAQRRLKEKSPV